MSAAACCGAGSRGASSSCTRARARRTRSTRCCSAGCRASRRARTCSASRAAGGSPAWSCRVEERESVDAGIRVRSSSWTAEIAAVERLIAQQALGLAGDPPADDRPGREPDLRRDVHRRRRRPAPVPDQPQAGRLPRPGPEGPPVRRRAGAQRAGSASAARPPRAGRWSRPPGAWSCSPGRCTPSMTAPARGAGTARRSSRPPASSRSCSGACSPAARTTPTSNPSLTKKKLRRLELTAGAPKHAKTAARDLEQQPRDPPGRARSSPSRPRSPTSGWSKTSKPDAPARKVGASATPERA